MVNIVRVITKDRVYSIGQRLPVPDGSAVEPFFISIIQTVDDSEGNELIEFTCTPDEEAASEASLPREPDMVSDEVWEALSAYRSQAKQAMESKWLVIATIPRHDARIEMIVTAEEYMLMQSENDIDDVEPAEPGPAAEILESTPVQPEEQPKEQPLPEVLAVTPS